MTEETIELVLYVTGESALARRAVASLKRLCEEQLPPGSQYRVVDVTTEPASAREDRVLATPTLVKRAPGPPRRIVGDLSSAQAVLDALELDV